MTHPKPKTKRRVRKPKDLRVDGRIIVSHSELSITGMHLWGSPNGAKECRRLAKWLTQFADWEESRKK